MRIHRNRCSCGGPYEVVPYVYTVHGIPPSLGIPGRDDGDRRATGIKPSIRCDNANSMRCARTRSRTSEPSNATERDRERKTHVQHTIVRPYTTTHILSYRVEKMHTERTMGKGTQFNSDSDGPLLHASQMCAAAQSRPLPILCTARQDRVRCATRSQQLQSAGTVLPR